MCIRDSRYTLLDIIKEDQTETDSKYYTETVTLDSDSKDMEKIMPLLAATCEATTEDGYTGVLTLDTASIQVEASGYGTSTRNVSATRSYPNLSLIHISIGGRIWHIRTLTLDGRLRCLPASTRTAIRTVSRNW